MPKVKFDVTGQNADDSVRGRAKQPKPGVYMAKVVEVKPGYAKDRDTGEEDRDRPRIQVVVEILKRGKGKAFAGARLWDYISMTEASEWKLDQFLQAMGVASKRKRKGTFDTDKLVGKTVPIKVDADTYQGEYRARLGAYLLELEEDDDIEDEDLDDEEELDDDDLEDDDDDLDDDDEDDDDEDEDEEDDEDDEEDDDEDSEDYDEDTLMAMSKEDLAEVADEFEVDFPSRLTKAGRAKVVAAILEAIGEDEEDEEDEDEDEDEPEQFTLRQLKAKSLSDLKELAEFYEVSPIPKNKDRLVKAVKSAQDEYHDEDPF